MVQIDIKPLSVNECWQGKRYRTPKYRKYQKDVAKLLPKIEIPQPPFQVYYEFGFSSKLADWDNPVKPIQDILQKHYGFNDRHIKRAIVDVKNVPKGKEYIKFEITKFEE